MNYDQFKNVSCYEEFDMQCTLAGISKADVLYEIGHQNNGYYFFISKDGIFYWFDLEGNHIEDPHVLKKLKEEHIPRNITKCIIPDSVTSIGNRVFWGCESLKEITIPNSVTSIGSYAFSFCKSLKEIIIPDNITYIGYKTFSICELLDKIIFKGKTLEEVEQMETYPFGIKDESIIKCEM